MASRRKMLIEMIDYRRFIDFSAVIVFPILSAVGSCEVVLLFSMDFTLSQHFLDLVLQDANLCLKKLALAFLTD